MIKIFCDKCGKEIESTTGYITHISPYMAYCSLQAACINCQTEKTNYYDLLVTEVIKPMYNEYGTNGKRLYNCFCRPSYTRERMKLNDVRTAVIDICNNEGQDILKIRKLGPKCLEVLEDIFCRRGLIEYDYGSYRVPHNNWKIVYGYTYEEWRDKDQCDSGTTKQ